MLPARINLVRSAAMQQKIRTISKSRGRAAVMPSSGDQSESSNTESSKKMQEFHKKLKLDPVPRVSPSMRFVNLMLVKTNPNTGEFMGDAEKDPTKWGDWQHGGRVSDF